MILAVTVGMGHGTLARPAKTRALALCVQNRATTRLALFKGLPAPGLPKYTQTVRARGMFAATFVATFHKKPFQCPPLLPRRRDTEPGPVGEETDSSGRLSPPSIAPIPRNLLRQGSGRGGAALAFRPAHLFGNESVTGSLDPARMRATSQSAAWYGCCDVPVHTPFQKRR